jgi:hypothetical protein
VRRPTARLQIAACVTMIGVEPVFAGRLVVVGLALGLVASTGLEQYQAVWEEQILPLRQQIGFTAASLKPGPPSRQFKTVAVIGVK